MVETYPQQRMNGTGFTALVNPLGDALGEVEPRFGDARVDDKSDVAKRVEALSCDVAVLRCPGHRGVRARYFSRGDLGRVTPLVPPGLRPRPRVRYFGT